MWIDINYEIERLKNLKISVDLQYQKEINIVIQKIIIATNLKYEKKDIKFLRKMYENLINEGKEILEEIENDLQIILKAEEIFKKYSLTGIQK